MSLLPQARGGPVPFGRFGHMLASIAAPDERDMPILPAGVPDPVSPGRDVLSDVLLGAAQAAPQSAPAMVPGAGGNADPARGNRISRGHLIAGIFADMLAGAAGRPGGFAQSMQQQQQRQWEDARDERRIAATRETEERRARQPQFTNVDGVGHVAIDPVTLTARVVQPSRSPGQVYAESLGYEPGSDEYSLAIADYALRANGPTAFGQRVELQDDAQAAALERLGLSLDLQERLGLRRDETTRRGQDVSERGNIRSTRQSDANNRRSTGQSDTNNRRSTQQSDANSRRAAESAGRGRGRAGRAAAPAPASEPRAVGANGQQLVFRNGAWRDARTGAVVQ